MKHRIAVLNQKGGVGKTTSAVNLGAAMAISGSRVLVIDLDPQSHLSLHLGLDPNNQEHSTARVLADGKSVQQCTLNTSTPNLDILPASVDLAGCESSLEEEVARESILAHALDQAEEEGMAYDLIIFDCPPSLGVLTLNALTAARQVLVPVQTEFFSLQGLTRLLELVKLVQRRLNNKLELIGVLPCMVDSRRSLTKEVLAELERYLGDKLLPCRIRISVRLAEAPGHGRSIFAHAPRSHGAEDYLAAASKLRELMGIDKTA